LTFNPLGPNALDSTAMPLIQDTRRASRQTGHSRRKSVGFILPEDVGRSNRQSMSYVAPQELGVSQQLYGHKPSPLVLPHRVEPFRPGYNEPMTAPLHTSVVPGEVRSF